MPKPNNRPVPTVTSQKHGLRVFSAKNEVGSRQIRGLGSFHYKL